MNYRRQRAAPISSRGLLFTALASVLLAALVALRLHDGEVEIRPDGVLASADALPGATVVSIAAASKRKGVAIVHATHGDDPTSLLVKGRVVDVRGAGLPGVAIGIESAALATSDRDGAFTLRGVPEGERLVACDERQETVAPAVVRPGVPAIVVVAPRIAVAGTVIDADGRPVDGAMLSIVVAAETGEHTGVRGRQWLTFSDGDGAFVFTAAPALAEARLHTQHPGHRTDERALPIASPRGLMVMLVAEPRQQPVCGTVFGPDGAPFANATACMGEAFVASGADGTFTLAVPPRLPAGTPLFVLAEGCQPVALPDPRPGDGRAPLLQTVQLQPAIVLSGRIVDAALAPLPNWTVVLGDPTPLVSGRGSYASAEGRLGAARAVTDAAGQFVIQGVFPRSYQIEAWDEHGQRGVRAVASPNDGRVTLVVGERAATHLCGVVVDDDGRPVAGALVGEERPGCLASGALAMRFDQRATTGSDGRFELPLRGAALHLVVDADTIVPCRIAVPATAAAPIRLRVTRRRDVLVGEAGGGVLAFAPADAAGLLLPICEPAPGTFGLPTTTRSLVVHHHGVAAGVLPWPTAGDRFEVRLQPTAR